ncbi:MAG: CYTH domain-containing protein [Roseburia sp.]|nr:CYTH domain-containing protein [Roseburia sp.]
MKLVMFAGLRGWIHVKMLKERKKIMEIERKWLLKSFPDMTGATHREMETIYLSTDPEIRVRKITFDNGECKYVLTLKSNGGLSREEYESEVIDQIFEGAKRMAPIPPIYKEQYKMELGDHVIEFNNVDNNTFLYAEVEFKSEEEANTYKFPFDGIVIEEVTYDPKYKMKNYWKESVRLHT